MIHDDWMLKEEEISELFSSKMGYLNWLQPLGQRVDESIAVTKANSEIDEIVRHYFETNIDKYFSDQNRNKMICRRANVGFSQKKDVFFAFEIKFVKEMWDVIATEAHEMKMVAKSQTRSLSNQVACQACKIVVGEWYETDDTNGLPNRTTELS